MVRQDGEAILCKRWAQDVAQKAGAAFVIDGTRVGLRVKVKAAFLQHETPDDLRPTTCGQDHGLAPELGRSRGRQPSNGGCRQLRQHRVPGRQSVIDLKSLGTDPHHPSPSKRLEHAYLRHLNPIGHIVRIQVTKCTEDRLAVVLGNIETVQRDDMEVRIESHVA